MAGLRILCNRYCSQITKSMFSWTRSLLLANKKRPTPNQLTGGAGTGGSIVEQLNRLLAKYEFPSNQANNQAKNERKHQKLEMLLTKRKQRKREGSRKKRTPREKRRPPLVDVGLVRNKLTRERFVPFHNFSFFPFLEYVQTLFVFLSRTLEPLAFLSRFANCRQLKSIMLPLTLLRTAQNHPMVRVFVCLFDRVG